MLPLNPKDIFKKDSILIKHKLNGKYSFSKACSTDDTVTLELFCDRTLGVFAPKLHIRADGVPFSRTQDFHYSRIEKSYDVYAQTFDVSKICTSDALLFYTVSFSIGDNTMYFVSENNVAGRLVYDKKDQKEFKMLICQSDFKTPDWFKSGVMYHIFVDRFFKGSKKVPVRADAVINSDWYGGTPQYGNIPGDFCANNMFFGGTLYGITEKLSYLKELGVSVLYLSPIFEAYSNHKYDTGDYSKVDEMFGGDQAFDELVAECKKLGMHIILDGVFNHTGDDSIYFNKNGRYGTGGAYRNIRSEYTKWYQFSEYPDKYESWWGIEILPKLSTNHPEVENFLAGKGGIAEKYLKKGISGWRLDVADELPSAFLERLRKTVKDSNSDAVIIGEVWENAADKCSYNERRGYFRGKQLDGVMNYPIKNGIVSFINNADTDSLYDAVCDIYSSYPLCCSLSLMNIVGTHDTERILTVLGTDRYIGMCGDEMKDLKLTKKELDSAIKKLLCASVLQFTLPGVPSIYYGDEAGMEGGRDPFCRMPYPWGKENSELLKHYKKLCGLRRELKALCFGDLEICESKNGVFSFLRSYENETVCITVNMGKEEYALYENGELLYCASCRTKDRKLVLPRLSFAITKY